MYTRSGQRSPFNHFSEKIPYRCLFYAGSIPRPETPPSHSFLGQKKKKKMYVQRPPRPAPRQQGYSHQKQSTNSKAWKHLSVILYVHESTATPTDSSLSRHDHRTFCQKNYNATTQHTPPPYLHTSPQRFALPRPPPLSPHTPHELLHRAVHGWKEARCDQESNAVQPPAQQTYPFRADVRSGRKISVPTPYGNNAWSYINPKGYYYCTYY